MAETGADKVENTDLSRPATLEQIMAAVRGWTEAPTYAFKEPQTGLVFHFKKLTGQDLDKIISWADGDDDKYNQLTADLASVNPKLDMATWQELGKMSPMVRAGILMAIRKGSAMGDEAMVDAKNALSELVTLS